MGLLRDMAERIRANASAGAHYSETGGAVPAIACSGSAPCSPAELAAFDLAWFAQRATAMVPRGNTAVRVEFVPATGPTDTDHFAISLQWRGARDRHSAALQVPAPPVAG
jgi:hypothetical protein